MAKTIFEQMGGTYTQQGDYILLYITVKMYPCSGGTDTGSPEL